MRRCAFLTTDDIGGYVTDDQLAIAPLADLGWQVDTVSWRSSVDWNGYDLVVVRSTWDYQRHTVAFAAALERIHHSCARLENALGLMRWNMDKRYLQDLQRAGVPIARTIFGHSPTAAHIRTLFRELDTDELVLKPAVGANADHVVRLHGDAPAHELERAADRYHGRVFLAQPFLPGVTSEGEYSLIYFNGEFSHAILKTPRTGDFRVQEEHGGVIAPVVPEAVLLAYARDALRPLPACPLYARVDLVRTSADQFVLMELELVEPALYLRMDANAPGRFAAAVARV